ncbi:M23 family metallopeptidase [Chryseobacterium sp. G0162]|uniref:M23 family metallopeptidase n=1 Tax=Chryseobacterium sp. G0162 TaxID=2487063 RepID=UPI000F4D7758|nr:M23 family metallopeptidase [Chryseobacterium sp. G0162]AZB11032.1 M23 family metallopeptidase [Chryseobacterium sp. G0162]
MAKLTITGNTQPIVGNTEAYSLSVFDNLMSSNSFSFPPSKVQWNIHVKDQKGWRITHGNAKDGEHITYKFTHKSLKYKALKIEVTRGKDKGELYIKPQPAEEPKILRVDLLDINSQRLQKGKLLHYTDTLIAKAHCVGMFGHKVSFTLWEDDAIGEGHDPVINMMNRINPVPLVGEVDHEGIAKVIFRLPSYTMAVQIANAQVARGDQNEGKTHEYYVTAEMASKHILKASPNVNVANPTHVPEPPKKQKPKETLPAHRKPPVAPEKKDTKPAKPKPKEDTPKFPQTPAARKQADPEGKIISVEFTDATGKPLKNAKTGDVVSIKISTRNMSGKNVKVRIWEEDFSRYSNDLVYEVSAKLAYNTTNFINGVILTKDMYTKSYEWGEGNEREYFIEVEHLNTSVTSQVIPVSPDAEPVKVEANDSPSIIKEPKQEKKGSCICQEQYKDLVWGEKVSCEFRKKVVQICAELWGENRKMEMANGLMAVMKVETNGTFKAQQLEGWRSVKDPKEMTIKDFWKEGERKSSRAVGLIQFTQDALQNNLKEYKSNLKLSVEERFDELNKLKLQYAQMGEIKQLDKIKKYFESQKNSIKSPEDIYLSVFAPIGVGKSNDYILYQKYDNPQNNQEKTSNQNYQANKSVDQENNYDHKIQRNEILGRYKISFTQGSGNKPKTFACENAQTTPQNPTPKGNKWHDPVDNPMLCLYTQNGNYRPRYNVFGTVRKERSNHNHQGIDILALPSSNVYACVDAYVEFISVQPGYGNVICLKVKEPKEFLQRKREINLQYSNMGEIEIGPGFSFDGDFYLFYAHLQEIDKSLKVKQEVTCGKIIGKNGTSGYGQTKDPHLHFEIKSSTSGGGLSNRCHPGIFVYYKDENTMSETEKNYQKEVAQKFWD